MKKRNRTNPIAKQLGTKLYANRIVPDKRRKLRDKNDSKEINDGKTNQTER
jgi:hypothetical protein